MGKVKTASGRTLAMPAGAAHPCVLDWALIDLNTETLKSMLGIPKLKANSQLPRTREEVSLEATSPPASRYSHLVFHWECH